MNHYKKLKEAFNIANNLGRGKTIMGMVAYSMDCF